MNKLCSHCVNTCKQPDSARIVSCPKFLKRPSEENFRTMVGDLRVVEKAARKKQRAIRELINDALGVEQDHGDENEIIDDEQGG